MFQGRWRLVAGGMIAVLALTWSPSPADGDTVGVRYGMSGVIEKIRSGMLFVKSAANLQFRTISPNKADRVGLHEAKTGETVMMLVDSGNVLMDVVRAGRSFSDHRIIAVALRYADPYWSEIQLSTPEGFERFEVDPLAGSKLSVYQAGTSVAVELDADNLMIDIHRAR